MACLATVIIANLKSLFLHLHDFVLYFRVNILEWVSKWERRATLECFPLMKILRSVTFFGVKLVHVVLGIYAGIVTSFIINTVRTQRRQRESDSRLYIQHEYVQTAFRYSYSNRCTRCGSAQWRTSTRSDSSLRWIVVCWQCTVLQEKVLRTDQST